MKRLYWILLYIVVFSTGFGIVYPILERKVVNAALYNEGTFTTPSNSIGPTQRKLARFSNGVLLDTFRVTTGGGNNVVLSISTDNGSTWSPRKYQVSPNVTGRRNNTRPSIVVDSNDVAYIFFEKEVASQPTHWWVSMRKFYRSNFSFSTKIMNITKQTFSNPAPSVVIDSNNDIYLAWCNTTYVRFRKYFNSNNTWNQKYFNMSAQATSTGTNNYPNIAINMLCTLVSVVWSGDCTVGSNYAPRIRWYYPGNNSFNPVPLNITGLNGYNSGYPTSVFDRYGDLIVIWHRAISAAKAISNIQMKRWYSSNGTWNPAIINVTKSTRAQNYATISMNWTSGDYSLLWYGQHNASTTYYRARQINYTYSTNTFSQITNWTKTYASSISDINSLFAWFPIIGGVRTNAPKQGSCFSYINGSFVTFGYTSNIKWNVSLKIRQQGYWNLSFKHTPTTPIYIDDNYNNATLGYNYNKFSNASKGILAVANHGTVYIYVGNYTVKNTDITDTITLIGNGTRSHLFGTTATSHILNPSTAQHTNISNLNFSDAINIAIWVNAENTTIHNCTFYNNNIGVTTYSANTTINNCTFNKSITYGMDTYQHSRVRYTEFNDNIIGMEIIGNNGIIHHCYFNDTTGISIINDVFSNIAYNNLIFNNYFDCTDNIIETDSVDGNIFNINPTIGPNIIGGPSIGGNYYSNNTKQHTGSGFSLSYSIPGTAIVDNYPVIYQATIQFGYWNISFKNSLVWKNQGYWNISFMNTSLQDWKQQGYWNLSFKNTQHWTFQGYWNLSFRNSSAVVTIMIIYPTNGSVGIPLHTAIWVVLNSSKGYDMNLTFYGSEDNGTSRFWLSNTLNTTNSTCTAGFWNATIANHRYDYKVIADDGHNNWCNKTIYYTCGAGAALTSGSSDDGIYFIAAGLLIGLMFGQNLYRKRRKRKQ